MARPEKIVYTAHATSTGGREGRSTTDDKQLDVKLTVPKSMGGPGGEGTNPEQLFAAGYSACFLGALKLVSGKEKVKLPDSTTITGEVGIGPNSAGGFALAVELKINAPGMDKGQMQSLVEKAHQVCPYSNATRNNVEVKLTVV